MATRKKKTASRKKSTSSRSKNKSAQRVRRKHPWLLYFFLPGFLLGILYLVYLDFTIRTHFEGKRWELPARVYARPLEIYTGKRLKPADLQYELKLLAYTQRSQADQPGSYFRLSDGFLIHTRAFQFWDGSEPSRQIRVQFEQNYITSITDPNRNEELTLVRFDPAFIAGIYPKHHEDRILVKLNQVPDLLIMGLIAVEDRKFLKHRGIDFYAIGRAMWANLRAGRTVQGGSTITQQLVKNFFLSNERSLLRKINEALMAPLLEWHYRKEEILEAYLNEIYLGQDGMRSIHGFGLASQFYFNRSVKSLRLHELALLVGMVKGASYYDPRRHPERALKRRNLVLKIMAEQGVIDADSARTASGQPLGVAVSVTGGVTAYPAFLELVKSQLRRDYKDQDLSSEGLRIFTTLDPLVQRNSEAALSVKIKLLEKQHHLRKGLLEGALVVSSVEQAEIQAIVGGRQPRFAGFNRALHAYRPIGSLVKPAVYLTALRKSKEYNLATLLDDTAYEFVSEDKKVWAPQNYDKEFHERIPLYVALMNSYNVSTARLGMSIGLDRVIDTLVKLGFDRPVRSYPSLLLGAVAMNPLEVAQIYQTIASSGFYSPLRAIRAVIASDGKPLQRYPLTVGKKFGQNETFLLKQGMYLVTRGGTAHELQNLLPADMRVAGKTGTTDDLRDSWFAGFSGDKLAVVWLGADDNTPVKMTGGSGAMRVWADLMAKIAEEPISLELPEGLRYVWVDSQTGKRSDSGCEGAIQLPFINGTEPTEEAPCTGRLPKWLDRLFGK